MPHKRLPDWLLFPIVLVIVTGISAASLTALKGVTDPYRARIQAELTEAALGVVMPEATSFAVRQTTVDGKPFSYRVAKKGEATIGYVAEGHATGYSSVIRVMVGVDTDFAIQGIKVLSQKETPGLGDKIMEIRSKRTWGTVLTGTSPDERGLRPWFQTQFDGLRAPVKVDKDGGKIDAITGATITSRAVCTAVDSAVAELQRAIGN